MSYIEDTLARNKKLIDTLREELQIKEEYDYLISDQINSIFISAEKDKDDPTGIGLGGRTRIIVKFYENDKLKRKAIKNLSFPKKAEDYEKVAPISNKMGMFVQLFREQKLLLEFIQLEEGLKMNNSQLRYNGEAGYSELGTLLSK